MNTGVPDEQYPIDIQAGADEREQKKELLKQFFEQENIQYEDGIPVNYSKFLYLFGEQNTGKLALVKEVAQELYGNQWESKIYIRVDDGQRYPYKLHAHKVESSRKVLLLTHKRCHWQKWKELYPSSKTFIFEGIEVIPNSQGLMTIRYGDFSQQFRATNTQFRNDLHQTVRHFFEQHNLSSTLADSLCQRFVEHIRSNNINTLNAMTSAEVSNQQV